MMRRPFGKSKHKKLLEDWRNTREPVLDGVSFFVKNLGMMLVDEPSGEDVASEAVRRIVTQAKMSSKKLPKLQVTVTPKGLKFVNTLTKEEEDEISIYRISYCTADKNHDKVFAFIATRARTEVHECYAYMCAKRKIAEALTLTVAHAFHIAFELWEVNREQTEKVGSLESELTSSTESSSTESAKHSENEDSTNNNGHSVTPLSSYVISKPLPIPLTATNGSRGTGAKPPSDPWSMESSPDDAALTPPSATFPNRAYSAPTQQLIQVSAVVHHNSKNHTQQHHHGSQTTPIQADRTSVESVTTTIHKWGIDEDQDLDEFFSKLAERRPYPEMLDIGGVQRTKYDNQLIELCSGPTSDPNMSSPNSEELVSL